MNLRNFLFLIVLTSTLVACSSASNDSSGQVVHHVFFWLKNAGNEADRNQLVEGLNSLRQIDEVKELKVGFPAPTKERAVIDNSYDVSELMIFESVEDQDAYQVHPLHQQFVDEYSHLWEKVMVYDMIVE